MKKLYIQYKEVILYLFFGMCTTFINVISYYICAYWLNLFLIGSTIVAWILAVIFAFMTNKIFVFESRSCEPDVLVQEIVSFFLCRAVTGILDISVMYIGVDLCGFYDVSIKVFSNILVILLNYVASKCMIFGKGK